MKKILSAVLCLMLAATMLFVFAGCSSEQDKFIGTWKADVDMSEMITEAMGAEDNEILEYIDLKDFTLSIELSFKEDSTYKMSVDEDSAQKAFENMKEDFSDGMKDYFEDYISEMGLDMTVDEFCKAAGTDFETMMDEALTDDMVDEIIDEMSSEGKFLAEDGKLYMSDGVDSEVDKSEYETYEISEDELKLTSAVGTDDMPEGLYPMVFKKVN